MLLLVTSFRVTVVTSFGFMIDVKIVKKLSSAHITSGLFQRVTELRSNW